MFSKPKMKFQREQRINKTKFEHEVNAPFISIHKSYDLDERATFCMALIERWGMVAGRPDGEDSAGRAKLRLSGEQELVKRAVNVTKLTFDAIESNGWVSKVPTLAQIDKEIALRESKKDCENES